MSLKNKTKAGQKQRSQSETAQQATPSLIVSSNPSNAHESLTVENVDIYNWKLKKEKDGSVYASYGIHVILRNGLKWIVEKRYSQFRELRKDIKLVHPDMAQIEFPKKKWFFNLNKTVLTDRQQLLNTYLRELILWKPQPMELCTYPTFFITYCICFVCLSYICFCFCFLSDIFGGRVKCGQCICLASCIRNRPKHLVRVAVRCIVVD
jgi:hypothetical protein